MKRFASFFIGFTLMAVALLPLSSLSYAEKSMNQVTVSAVVLEHITYYENGGNITVQTNLKNETVVVRQEDGVFVTVKI